MNNKLADIQWIRTELDDLVVLLRVHGIEELAKRLDGIHEDLQLLYDDCSQKRTTRHSAERALRVRSES
jgi:hypothetical protein